MPDKKANHFANTYPNRFQIYFKQEDTKMPQLPTEKKALANGAHVLVALEVETTKGMYGEQEEVTCMLESNPETLTRVWVTHKTLAQIKAAAAAGLVRIDEESGSWEVVIGSRFQVFVAGGKVVGVSAPPAAAPIVNGSQS
jgi:hypothetical protein